MNTIYASGQNRDMWFLTEVWQGSTDYVEPNSISTRYKKTGTPAIKPMPLPTGTYLIIFYLR